MAEGIKRDYYGQEFAQCRQSKAICRNKRNQHDGLEPFLQSARFNYLIGNVYGVCNAPDKARTHFKQATEKSTLADAVWASKASQQLPDFDAGMAKQKLQDLLDRAKNSGESNSPNGWWLYNAALLDKALGNSQLADREFREALLSHDMRAVSVTLPSILATPQSM